MVFLLLACAAAATIVRLQQGPVRLDWVIPLVEPALEEPALGVRVKIGGASVSWGEFAHPLDLQLQEVRIFGPGAVEQVAIPELGVGISMLRLLGGQVVPTSLVLKGLKLKAVRDPAGALAFGIGFPLAGRDEPVAAQPPTLTGPGDVLAFLERPPDPDHPLGLLRSIAVTGAELVLEDQHTGKIWQAPVSVVITREGRRLEARAELGLQVGTDRAVLRADASHHATGSDIGVTVALDGLKPRMLADLHPALANLAGIEPAVSGTLSGRFSPDGVLGDLSFDLTGSAGMVTVPGAPAPVRLDQVLAQGRIVMADRRIDLTRLQIGGTVPTLTAPATGPAPALTLAGAGGLRQDPRGVIEGSFTGTVAVGAAAHTLTVSLTPEPVPNGGMAGTSLVTVRLNGVRPDRLADLAPLVAPLAGVTLPFDLAAQARLDAGFRPSDLEVTLATRAAGRLAVPVVLPDPVRIKALSVRVKAAGPLMAPARVDLVKAAVDFDGPKLEATGAAVLDGDRYRVTTRINAAGVPVDRLQELWPTVLGPNAKLWIVENLTRGVVDRAWVAMIGHLPLATGRFKRTKLEGGFSARDVDARYFRTLPPAVGLAATATTDGVTLAMETTGGRVLDLALGPGQIIVSKLDEPQEYLEVKVPVSGPLRTVLTVLDYPPLLYAKKFKIDPAGTGGDTRTDLRFYFPLIKDLDTEDIEISAKAEARQTAIRNLAGFKISDGNLGLDLDQNGMTVKGQCRVDGVASTVDWQEFFRDDAPIRSRIHAVGTVQEADLARRKLNIPPYQTGPVKSDLLITIDRRGALAIDADLDLQRAILRVPELRWSKPRGKAGRARFRVLFRDDIPVKVVDLRAETADASATGTVELDPADGAFRRLRLSRLTLGRSTVAAEMAVEPNGSYAMAAHGAVFDLAPLMAAEEPVPPPALSTRAETVSAVTAVAAKPRPFKVQLQVERLLTGIGPGLNLRDVYADLAHDGIGWDRAEVIGRVGHGTGTVQASFRPAGNRRKLSLVTDDVGALLHNLEVYRGLRGGTMTLVGEVDPLDPARVLTGTAEVLDFKVIEAPLLARLLNALSITGLIELLQGERLTFSRMIGDYVWTGDRLTVKDVRASGSALGLTVDGNLDMVADRVAVRGTIVPIYGFNRILGMVPLLGDLLSGGEGHGLFAATFTMTGPFAAPEIAVNPLSILAPGFLRNLFFLGGDDESTAKP